MKHKNNRWKHLKNWKGVEGMNNNKYKKKQGWTNLKNIETD